MKFRLFLASAMLFVAFFPQARAQIYEGRALVEPALIADTTAIVPGKPFRVGLLLKMAPHWHTYWQYGGDAGIPTEIKWRLPAGFGVGPIEWPLPARMVQAEVDIVTFGYSGEVMLIQAVQPPVDLKPGGTIELEADVSWLVCEEICIPGKAALSLSLPVAAQADPANAEAFEYWSRRLPLSDPPPFPVAWSRDGKQLVAKVTPPAGTNSVEFFPLPAAGELIGHSAITGPDNGVFTIRIEAKDDLRGVLVTRDAAGEHGWQVVAAPSAASLPVSSAAPEPEFNAPAIPTLWLALAWGFLGGLILNLMPCVLPVISLKIFGFVQQAGQSRRRFALHGLAFSAGIFAWFLSLGAVIVALKSGGAQVTWAFQFQNPWFNLAIATVVFIFALNLFGVFELSLPGRAATGLAKAGGAEGYGGSFFQGVFATLLATPCTGPFLGSSLGFAFSQPGQITMLMFASMALGMALPYLALSAQPGWVRFLPKPGAWMERLKQFMGFPLLAALLWLLYIIGAQRGSTAVIWAAAFLLTLGIALWIYGAASAPGTRPLIRVLWQIIAFAIAIAGGWIFIAGLFAEERAPDVRADAAHADGIPWMPYSKAEVDRLLAEGRPVFIDFTADWCLSCKFNERTAIDTAAVRRKIAELGIIPVKADWTNANPEITAALQRFGRVGVPFYVLYPADRPEAPILMPELLTESLVLNTLEKAKPEL